MPLDDQLAWADELASGDEITVHSTTGPYYGDFLEEAGGLWLVPESREEWKAVMKAVDAGEDPAPRERLERRDGIPGSPVSVTTVIDLG